MKRRRKLIIALTAMTVLVLFCVYYILTVPHDAGLLIGMCGRGMGHVSSMTETASAETSVTVDQDDVESLKEVGEKSVEVPIKIKIDAACSDASSHIKRVTEYTVFGEKSEVSGEFYYDALDGTLYYDAPSGWKKRGSVYAPAYDLNALFERAASLKDSASIGRSGRYYTLRIPAADFGSILIEPFVKNPDSVSVTGGEAVLYFDRRSKSLCRLKTKGLTICSAGLVGSDGEESATSSLKITADFVSINETPEDQWSIPEEVLAGGDMTSGNDSSARFILSTEDLKRRGKTSYTAGVDFPAGSYFMRRKEGAGILKVLAAEDGAELLIYKSGYNYYKIDSEDSRKEAELGEGDRIILTGDDFEVMLEAK